jgi:hypothetical protein
MKKLVNYQIVNHGYDHAQYFQGQSTYGTDYDHAVIGVGDNAVEAYNDAVELLYQMDIDAKSIDRLIPEKPRGLGITVKNKVPARLASQEGSEYWWYVSILAKVADHE